MIITNKEKHVLDTNESLSEVIKAEIHNSAVIIDYLRNKMYNHKIQTPVQEYISNAIDAMNSIGNKNPIQITLPSGIKQEFKVRDFGPGLCEEDMKKVFSQYGNSSKTGSNLQIGGYGLGSKSGWAYSPVFFVSSYFNGKKFIYIARIGDNQEGEFIKSAVIDTDEANGIEISIPVIKKDDIQTFIKATYRASTFREVKPIILEDSLGYHEVYEEIEKSFIETSTYKLISKSYLIKSVLNLREDIVISIDGVPYALPTTNDEINELKDHILRFLGNSFLIIKAKTGEVLIQPDRERISEDENTLSWLIQNLSLIKKDLLKKRLKLLNTKHKDLYSFIDCSTNDSNIFSNYITTGKYKRSNIIRPSFNHKGINLTYENKTLVFNNLYHFKNKLISLSKKFDELSIFTIKGNTLSKRNPSDNKKQSLRLEIELQNKEIFLNNDRVIYLEVDEEITEFQLKRKIRLHLSKNRNYRLYVIPKGFLEFFNFKIQNLVKSSKLELPKKAIKEKDSFSVNNYHSSWYGVKRTRREIDLNSLKENQNFIYMKLEKNANPQWFEDLSNDKKQELLDFLSSKGFGFCSFGNNMEEKIKNNKNFINIEDYKKTLSTSLNEIAVLFNREDTFFKELKSINPKFINENINEIFFLATNIKGNSKKIPSILVQPSPENEKIVKAVKEDLDSFTTFFKDQFSLVYSTSFVSDSFNTTKNEIVNYCNLKLEQIKKNNMSPPKLSKETIKIIQELKESKKE